MPGAIQTMARRVKVIYNPAASGGQPRRRLAALKQCLSAGGAVDLSETAQLDDATALAAQAQAEGYEVVAAAGGDGTVNAVVNGLMSAEAPTTRSSLGIIPLGSGNDFAWAIGIGRSLPEAGRRLFSGTRRMVDVGWLSDDRGRAQYFCNGIEMGFDAVVAKEASKIRCLGGLPRYLAALVRAFVRYYRAPPVTVRLDGEELSLPALMVTVFNGRRYGAGFHIAPNAALDDGYLDLCIVPALSRATILRMLPKLIRGTHVNDGRIHVRRSQQVSVEAPEGLAAQVDGEIISEHVRRLEARVLPRQLPVVV